MVNKNAKPLGKWVAKGKSIDFGEKSQKRDLGCKIDGKVDGGREKYSPEAKIYRFW